LVWRIGPEGRIRKIEWEVPAGLQVETVVPDGDDALWVVSATKLLRLALERDPDGVPRGGKLTAIADVGSPAGAVAREAGGTLLLADGSAVKRVTREGQVTDVLDAIGAEIYGLAPSANDGLLLTDWEHGRLIEFKAGVARVLATGLDHPSGVVVTRDGSILVKESGRQTGTTGVVKRIAADGRATLLAKLVPPR